MIVIIGILAAIAVVGYSAVIDKSEVEAAKQELVQLGKEAAAMAAFDQVQPSSASVNVDANADDVFDLADGDTVAGVRVVDGVTLTLTFDGYTPVVID